MNVEIIKSEKNELDLKIDNPTVAEVVRVYLNEQGVDFAAWRREHPSNPVSMTIKSSGKTVAKAISDAVEAIKKDCDKIVSVVKK
jgi:DNA-directed RNA polymerase subunit L